MQGIHQLIYTSAATGDFTQAELHTLLQIARRNNHRLGVTGILVYCNRTFFQVLEGPQSAVDSIYAKIAQDPRHKHLRIIARSNVARGDFGDWSMGFVTDTATQAKTEGLNAFLTKNFSLRTFTESPTQARSLLVSFRLGNWRDAVEIK